MAKSGDAGGGGGFESIIMNYELTSLCDILIYGKCCVSTIILCIFLIVPPLTT